MGSLIEVLNNRPNRREPLGDWAGLVAITVVLVVCVTAVLKANI